MKSAYVMSLFGLFILSNAIAGPEIKNSPELEAGVVFFIPETPEKSLAALEALKADGFNMIKLASWVWTVPTPESPLRENVTAILNWCDANDVGVWLLHNIQYGSTGDGGDVDEMQNGVTRVTRETLLPWAQTLQDHPCVKGVLLGNEVSSGTVALFEGHPRFTEAFHNWLESLHGDIATLNLRWGTQYASFDEIIPADAQASSPIDMRRFLNLQFARFYNTIAAEVLKPVLGEDVLYGSKGGASPYILSQMPDYTVCSWDDLLAKWPLWNIKMMCDTTGLPVYNSELHLYHDIFDFGPSPEISRYRYFTSALIGEWMTASFAWDQWNKEEIASVHAYTPKILADLKRLEPELRAFNNHPPAFQVLVTEATDVSVTETPVLELAYANAATTGLPWSFITDYALSEDIAPTIIIDSPWLTAKTAQKLAELSTTHKLIFVGQIPNQDEYSQPLPAELLETLQNNTKQMGDWSELRSMLACPRLPADYVRVVDTPYLWWSPEKGHYEMPVAYPKLEVRFAMSSNDNPLIAVINHTPETISTSLPVSRNDNSGWCNKLTGEAVDTRTFEFTPYCVELFEKLR